MNAAVPSPKPTSLLKLIPISFIVLNGILAISVLIAAHLSWIMAIITAIMFGLVVIAISFLYRENSFSWTALIAFIAALLCGMYINSYYDVKDREIAKNISPEEAVEYSDAGGFYFTEGQVRTDLEGTYVKRHRSSDGKTSISYYYAAPVVSKKWDKQQPVTVWAARMSYEKIDNWKQPHRAGLRVDPIFREDFIEAARQAAAYHGLKSHPNAVFIKWTASPEAAAEEYMEDFWFTANIWNIVWLVGLLAGRLYVSLRRRKKRKNGVSEAKADTRKPPEKISTPNLLRFLFVAYCFFALVYSLYFSHIDLSPFLPIMLLLIGIVFYIIAVTALLTAHKKEDRPLWNLLYVMIYPFMAYFFMFFSLDFRSEFFWMFPGYFYFLVITGGFVLGILFSPFMALGLQKGFTFVKNTGSKAYAGLLLTGGFLVLVYFFTRFLSRFTQLTSIQAAVFWFFLLVGIFSVIKFTYRHTVFYLAKDSQLKQKYETEKQ